MAKEVTATIKLQCPAGQATPAPPVGPALGQHGINIGQFVKQFNDETRAQQGLIIPVVISVYKDRSFPLAFQPPPAALARRRPPIRPILSCILTGRPRPDSTRPPGGPPFAVAEQLPRTPAD